MPHGVCKPTSCTTEQGASVGCECLERWRKFADIVQSRHENEPGSQIGRSNTGNVCKTLGKPWVCEKQLLHGSCNVQAVVRQKVTNSAIPIRSL